MKIIFIVFLIALYILLDFNGRDEKQKDPQY